MSDRGIEMTIPLEGLTAMDAVADSEFGSDYEDGESDE